MSIQVDPTLTQEARRAQERCLAMDMARASLSGSQAQEWAKAPRVANPWIVAGVAWPTALDAHGAMVRDARRNGHGFSWLVERGERGDQAPAVWLWTQGGLEYLGHP